MQVVRTAKAFLSWHQASSC